MNIPERIVAEQIDMILKRSAWSLEQQRIGLQMLPAIGPQATAAREALKSRLVAFDRLTAYRAKFD